MELSLVQFIKTWLLPPGILLLALGSGLYLLRRHGRLGRLLLLAATLSLWLLSTPWFSARLLGSLEVYPPLDSASLAASQAQAIVVLAGGYRQFAPEYGGATPSAYSLLRLNYGVRLHRASGLPILLSGGNADPQRPKEALLMARVLREDYGIEPRWLETKSRNSAENAAFSSEMLQKDGIKRILLVSQAWHLYRVLPLFEQQGMAVIAAPTGFEGPAPSGSRWQDFLPTAQALLESSHALHEYLGALWYGLRYRGSI